MGLHLWFVLLIAFASQTIFLLFLFILRPGENRPANRLLLALLCVIAGILLGNTWVASGLYKTWPALPGYFRGMLLLLGPLCYLYGRALLQAGFRLRAVHLLHLIPYLVAFTFARLQEEPVSAETIITRIDWLIAGRAEIYGWHLAWYIGYSVHVLLYFFLLRNLLRTSLQKQDENYIISIAERTGWMRRMTRSFLLVVITFAGILIYITATGHYRIEGNFIYTLVLAVWVYQVAFQSVTGNRTLFAAFAAKYQTTRLNEPFKDRLLARLLSLFEEEAIFTDQGLTLNRVAERLDIKPHALSQTINDKLKKSFAELVHQYRIAAFKEKAAQPGYAHYTIMALAAEVGYANKTSFNNAFKKECGVTPSVFIQLQKGPQQP
jgi:AraC-like DNA-binding protein